MFTHRPLDRYVIYGLPNYIAINNSVLYRYYIGPKWYGVYMVQESRTAVCVAVFWYFMPPNMDLSCGK